MITTVTPETWQDLQTAVATILTQCGMDVQVELKIQSVRTTVEVDVFATETVEGRRYTIICECKRWRAAVPQEVVHALRTVMQDIGANQGYVISTGGFQSGARAAAEATNLVLVTWEEFQAIFQLQWLKRYFVAEVTEKLDTLMGYTEPIFVPTWFRDLPEEGKEAYRTVDRKNLPLGLLAFSLSKYRRMMFDGDFPTLPLRTSLPDPKGLPDAVLDAAAYRELLHAMIAAADDAMGEFYSVRDSYGAGGAV